jgi:hypothetical protein
LIFGRQAASAARYPVAWILRWLTDGKEAFLQRCCRTEKRWKKLNMRSHSAERPIHNMVIR